MSKIRYQKVVVWFVCMFLYVFPSVSQEVIEVKGVFGESEIVGRISEVQAWQLAINKAKVVS